MSSSVSIMRSAYESPDIKALLGPLGGMEAFVNKGERVLLKVNLLSATDPAGAVTTHPSVVEAVARAVMDAGGEPFIADSPAGRFSRSALEKAYARAGLKEVADRLGIELNYDTSTRKVKLEGTKLRSTPVCEYLFRADKVIALPKAKTHSLMVMTLATKIMYGIVPGLTKAKYHARFPGRESFADMLLDVLSIRTPDLFIMDAITGMEGNGPQNGSPVDIGLLLASTDPVALDVSICQVLGVEPLDVYPLKRARIRGMWPADIEYPLLSPEDVRYAGDFRLPITKSRKRKVPASTGRCIGCGKCQDICPRGAVRVINGRATFDYSLCIRCYCCHEVCPVDAIDLVKPG